MDKFNNNSSPKNGKSSSNAQAEADAKAKAQAIRDENVALMRKVLYDPNTCSHPECHEMLRKKANKKD